jgi:hypothetical protein
MYHMCEYSSSLMVSSYSLSQRIATHFLPSSSFDQSDANIHHTILLAITLIIGVCGISSSLRKSAAMVILSIRMILFSVDSLEHVLSIGLSQTLHHFLDETLPFLDFCFIACILTIALRWIEVKYGPRRVPDTARSLLSIDYLSSLGVRRVRQLVEVVLYTLLPGYFFHAYIFGVDMITLAQKFRDYCGEGKFADFHGDAQSIEFVRDYVLIIISCGMFQRVFGSNPSYKGSIYDQYGRLLSTNADDGQSDGKTREESELSLWRAIFAELYTPASKVNATRGSYINQPMRSEQSADRSNRSQSASLKPSRSDKALI